MTRIVDHQCVNIPVKSFPWDLNLQCHWGRPPELKKLIAAHPPNLCCTSSCPEDQGENHLFRNPPLACGCVRTRDCPPIHLEADLRLFTGKSARRKATLKSTGRLMEYNLRLFEHGLPH